MGLKYWSANGISPQNDTLLVFHFYYCILSAFTTLDMKIYPVFKPNDYFWEHHWDEKSGEKKHEAYMRVIREEIIAKSFNFDLLDTTMEDKMDYKALIKGKKPKDKSS